MNTEIDDSDVTSADLLIEALRESGVSIVFANFGSDHAHIIEALAKARNQGEDVPAVVLCPHETTALSAAHGYAAATGRPQAVFVHCDVGTANLGGSVHNAARSHVPALIFAGLTPYTAEGELPGTRNHHINYLQDVHGQHDLVRPYVKWSYDIRTGSNIKQLVFRAMQLANSAPRGPVYLTAAREVLAEKTVRPQIDRDLWNPIAPIPASSELVDKIIEDIGAAKFPIIITSYLGQNPESVSKLVTLAESLGVAVVETTPSQMNFPADHPLHLGFAVDNVIADADFVLALDTNVPWVPAKRGPSPDARIYFVDSDPLKTDIPVWYMPSHHFIRADSLTLLDQLLAALPQETNERSAAVADRANSFAEIHRKQREKWQHDLLEGADKELTPEFVCATLSELIDDDTIIVNESITSAAAVYKHVPRAKACTFYGNGGSALGWSGGAAIGVKLARPDQTVISLVGDGTYFLSVPSSTYWVSGRYNVPFLTVIFDNGGWNATKQNLIKQHPGGVADTSDQYWVNFAQSADMAGIAQAAGGAYAATVTSVGELQTTLIEALARVNGGQSAVVSVRLAAISGQLNDELLDAHFKA